MSDEISVERLGQFATDIATLRHQIEQAKALEPDLVNPRIRPEIGTADMEPILDEILRLRAEVERLTAERDKLRVRAEHAEMESAVAEAKMKGIWPGNVLERAESAEARSAELERALRERGCERSARCTGFAGRSPLPRDQWCATCAALAAPEPVTLAQARQVALDAIDESDAAWSAEAEREAAPEPEGSAGDEGSRVTGRSPGRTEVVYGGASPSALTAHPTDLQAEAAPADPEEPRCPTIPDRGTLYMPCGHRKAVTAGEPLSWDCPDCQPEGDVILLKCWRHQLPLSQCEPCMAMVRANSEASGKKEGPSDDADV